jgi:hypothetical protein
MQHSKPPQTSGWPDLKNNTKSPAKTPQAKIINATDTRHAILRSFSGEKVWVLFIISISIKQSNPQFPMLQPDLVLGDSKRFRYPTPSIDWASFSD